jgi:hypothetical protein
VLVPHDSAPFSTYLVAMIVVFIQGYLILVLWVVSLPGQIELIDPTSVSFFQTYLFYSLAGNKVPLRAAFFDWKTTLGGSSPWISKDHLLLILSTGKF